MFGSCFAEFLCLVVVLQNFYLLLFIFICFNNFEKLKFLSDLKKSL